jgi:hypothetical protein
MRAAPPRHAACLARTQPWAARALLTLARRHPSSPPSRRLALAVTHVQQPARGRGEVAAGPAQAAVLLRNGTRHGKCLQHGYAPGQ